MRLITRAALALGLLGALGLAAPSVDAAPAPPGHTKQTPPWLARCITKPTSAKVVNVRDKGATGDGSTDDSAAFAKAVAVVDGTGGTLLVPAGDYRIDPDTPVRLGSHMTLRLADGAQLRALASDQESFVVVDIRDRVDVNVVGGTITGERSIHQGTTGEGATGSR